MIDRRIGHGASGMVRGAFPNAKSLEKQRLNRCAEARNYPKSALVVADFR